MYIPYRIKGKGYDCEILNFNEGKRERKKAIYKKKFI